MFFGIHRINLVTRVFSINKKVKKESFKESDCLLFTKDNENTYYLKVLTHIIAGNVNQFISRKLGA